MDPVTLVLFAILLVLPLIMLHKSNKKAREVAKVIDQMPGEKRYPIVGSQWSVLKAGRQNFFYINREKNKKYGPTYRNWVGNIPVVVTWKPEHIQALLTSRLNINKSDIYKFFREGINDGVFTSSKEKWRRDRKLVTPSFHLQMLDHFVPIYNQCSRKLCDKLLNENMTGKFFDVFPFAERLAFDVICETSIGVKIRALEEQNIEYMHNFCEIFEAMYTRAFNPLLHNQLVFNLSSTGKRYYSNLKKVHEFIQTVIDMRRTTRENIANNNDDGLEENDDAVGGKKKQILLDGLLDAYGSFEGRDDDWIKGQVITAVFAGFDTSSISLTWTLYALATNPDVQQRVYEEIKETLQDDPERDITLRDINNMNYLDRTVKEVLRMYSVVTTFARRVEEPIVMDGLTIPVGCMVSVQIYDLHMDPTIYPDPHKFDPDRFLPENVAKRHPFSYIPFSAGHRNCVGQKFSHKSLRIAVAHLVKRYVVTAQTKPEDIRYYNDLTMKPDGGMFLRFDERV